MSREITYRGMRIRECLCERGNGGKRWYVQSYHSPTGLPWSEEECAHYYSQRAAKEAIAQERNYVA